MARGLIPLGINTANQALTGLTKEAQLGAQREMAEKRLEFRKESAKYESITSAASWVIGSVLSAFTFGMAGKEQKQKAKEQLQTPPQGEGRSEPMAMEPNKPPDIQASATEGIGGL
jgi:hypothetical protein